MNCTRLAAVACGAFLLAAACRDERVGELGSELQAMRNQVQQLQVQLAEQATQQERTEAQMVEWLDATSRQLDRFLDRIGAPPMDIPADKVPGTAADPAPDATAPRPAEPVAVPGPIAGSEAPVEAPLPASVGSSVLLLTVALLAVCAGIGFAALRTLRRDADPAPDPAAPAPVDDGHSKLLTSLTEWEQQHAPATPPPVAEASPAIERRDEESVPIAAVHPEIDDLETPAHHAGPAVVEPDSAAIHREPEAIMPEVLRAVPRPGAGMPDAHADAVARPGEAPAVDPAAAAPAAEAPPQVASASGRFTALVEHEVPGRISIDATAIVPGPGSGPLRLPGPPRACFRAMTTSPEDAAVALAAILQIDPRVMRRPAPTVSTTPTTVVAEYSLVPVLPPGERGALEARLWQAVGDARKHGSQPLPSL